MTRINVLAVQYLSDQHLIAEYRELPRIIKQHYNLKDDPLQYKLGKGHVKWAKIHEVFCIKRYKEICDEMQYRGFTVNFPYEALVKIYESDSLKETYKDYTVSEIDKNTNYMRLKEKIDAKPNFYRWTNRSFEKSLFVN